MSYVPPIGSSVGLQFTVVYSRPGGGSVNLEFSTPVGNIRQASADDNLRFGTPALLQSRFVRARGADVSSFGGLLIQSDVPRIRPESIVNIAVVGTPQYVSTRQFLDVPSLPETVWPFGGRVRTGGGYNAPPAFNLILDWRAIGGYSVPPAENLILEFGSLGSGRILGATLFDQLSMGAPEVAFQLGAQPAGIPTGSAFGVASLALSGRVIQFPGIDSQELGAYTIRHAARTIALTGVPSNFSAGTAGVILSARRILVGGIPHPPQTGANPTRRIPDPRVEYRIRTAFPTSVRTTSPQIGAQYVAFEYQFIDLAGRGIARNVFGSNNIWDATRYITTPFIASNIFGTANVARIQKVFPSGWSSSLVSEESQQDINLQRIFCDTGEYDPAVYGVPNGRNQREIIYPLGKLSLEFNFPVVFNKKQFLHVGAYKESIAEVTSWGNYYPFVRNRNVVMRLEGNRSSRFGVPGHAFRLAARLIRPEGLYSTVWGADTFIAYRIRTISGLGWEEFYSSNWHNVYNSARVLRTVGRDSAVLGAPGPIRNLNRTFNHLDGYFGEEIGTAFIAYAIRHIFPPHMLNATMHPLPEVRLNPYPITPVWVLPHPNFGSSRVAILPPHQIPVFSVNVFFPNRVGFPTVVSRNRTFRAYSVSDWVVSEPNVRNYKTYSEASGHRSSTISNRHFIGRRNRFLVPPSLSRPTFSTLHQVRNEIPDPPGPQYIMQRNGIAPTSFPRAFLKTRTIDLNPLNRGIYEGGFGLANVSRNVIRPREGIFNLEQVGIPFINGLQLLFPQSVPPFNLNYPDWGDSDYFPSKGRVTPHTIYAPFGDMATAQAKFNNPSAGPPNPINTHFVPRPLVTNKNRIIGPVPNHVNDSRLAPSHKFGNAEVTLRMRRIFPAPLYSFRPGWIIILGVTQHVNLDFFSNNGIPRTTVFGPVRVGPPFAALQPFANPVGFDATIWGTTRIELFNRRVFPVAKNPPFGHNTFGLAMMGFTRFFPATGSVMTIWGQTEIDYKNRTRAVQGFDSCTLGRDDITAFALRMKVTRRNPPGGIPGIPSSIAFGLASATHFTRMVHGRGPNTFVSGAPTVRESATIFPSGWDSLVVGNIDRWEAGVIKAHGDDLGVMGTPRMMQATTFSGIFNEVVSPARLTTPLYVLGIPVIGFDGPILTDPSGANNRVIAVLPVLPINFPSPVVT